jgi:hypothetical protein
VKKSEIPFYLTGGIALSRVDQMRLVQEAKTKEAAADIVIIFEILKSFPIDELSSIRWTTPADFGVFKKELDQIANDILHGNHNTLAILS